MLVQADEVVAIPQSDKVESLNAGIAASMLLYETAGRDTTEAVHHGDHGAHRE